MQYVILRVALHEVLTVIALGHVEANVKSFGKKIKKTTIFKIIISKRYQMKNKIFKKMKIINLISFQNKNIQIKYNLIKKNYLFYLF